MPSQATNYFYTLVAMGVISLMLTNAFEGQVSTLGSAAEKKELRRLMEAVAAEGTELVGITEATGATVKVCVEYPTTIGKRQYWVRLASDGSRAWVEGGFGEPWTGTLLSESYLPWNVSASGIYRGGYGTLSLNCTDLGSGPVLALGRLEDG
jgi:hypothetical protein